MEIFLIKITKKRLFTWGSAQAGCDPDSVYAGGSIFGYEEQFGSE